MFPKTTFHRRSQRSSALVIVLAAIVLISAIVLVFFQQSTLNRQISFSSAGQYRADLTAHTAMDTIIGDLRDEISAGSKTTINGFPATVNGTNIYVPMTNATAVPYPVIPTGDVNSANLVKQSTGGSPFWTGNNYAGPVVSPVRSVVGNSTTNTSLNGRAISIGRWNLPGLLGDPGSSSSSGYPKGSPNYTTAPDWVIVTRGGVISQPSNVPLIATLANKSVTNLSYAVGRYAYTIYDEGGLLDVNVAGYPDNIHATDDFATKRGLMPQVNLGNIPGVTDSGSFVQWRNVVSANSAESYTNFVFTATNGFTTVAPGDQTLLSRRDLINYVQANSSQIATSALQYLGTFTRAVNAPSYSPPALNSTLTRPATLSGQGYRTYSDPGNLDDQFNPSLINTRVTTTWTTARSSDGSIPTIGEPLIKYRFPLSRLALFGNSNSSTDNGTGNIFKYFGLTRTSPASPWVYNHGDPEKILKLSEVSSAGREPDFFELLQAGILVGSLGKTASNPFNNVTEIDSNNYCQIIQIGANLMDQYDTDSFPTRITLLTMSGIVEMDGIENLPYLMEVFETPYRLHSSPNQVGVWYQPVIWNPHAEAMTLPTANAPTQFRFRSVGTEFVSFGPDPSLTPGHTYVAPAEILPLSPTQGLVFFNSTSFVEPQMLNTVNASLGDPTITEDEVKEKDLAYPDGQQGSTFLGICAGLATFGANTGADTSLTTPQFSMTHQLQYLSGGNWITYSQMQNIALGLGSYNGDNFIGYAPYCYDELIDPRTARFGAFGTDDFSSRGTTIRSTTGQGSYINGSIGAATGWTFPLLPGTNLAGNVYLGYLSQNLQSINTRYTDPDSVQRRADGAYTVKTTPLTTDGLPLAIGNLTSRPVILNRPFRSVAEMGYASRGMPWKHLDFFTLQSADAALLDLFCLNDETPSPPATEAGQVDLNTKQTPVLSAIIQGALKAEDDPITLSPGEATSLASILTTMTASSPLLNRSELVTRWISSDSLNIPSSPVPNVTTVLSSSDEIIKRRREAAVRALADVGNTRTWNLLIDIIAQSGQYTTASTGLDQFLVAGEKRYWLHLAIDRYTGKIVAQSLEPVYE